MILVPHQDDEIIMCGAFLKGIIEAGNEVTVVFMTNGDYTSDIGSIRMQESLDVLRLYGISKDNVIFMGYANEYDIKGPHIYDAKDNRLVFSQYGNCYTYGLPDKPEYCYSKRGIHNEYRRSNVLIDLKDIILEIMPDVIFATDVEIHPDHKANSLFLDEVLGQILHELTDYSPTVLKKPEYSTGWNGEKDYSLINNLAAQKNGIKSFVNYTSTEFTNPYIRWQNRIRLPIDKYARTPIREDNILFQSLKLYKTQNVIDHFESLANSDVVFWMRRTDSLTYRARVYATSGKAEFINDFKIFDSSDIKRTSIDSWFVDESIWRPDPEDKNPEIIIEFDEEKWISEIVIYQEYVSKSQVTCCNIEINDEKLVYSGKLEKKLPTHVIFEAENAKKITIKIIETTNEKYASGISEIEVYEAKRRELLMCKMMVEGNFVYDYFCHKKKPHISVYELYSDGTNKISTIDAYNIQYMDKNYGQRIRIESKENSLICDEINIIFSKQNYLLKVIKNKDDIESIKYLDCLTIEEKRKLVKKLFFRSKVMHQTMMKFLYKCIYLSMFSRNQWTDEDTLFLLTGEIIPDLEKYIREYIAGDKKKPHLKSQSIYFVGTPNHFNLGDHAIAYATRKLLEKLKGNNNIEEITIEEFPYRLRNLRKEVKKNDVFIMQGGGNMGNRYWTNERVRREIIKNFPKNRILIFPETIYYDKSAAGDTDLEYSKQCYSTAEKLVIFAREQSSYDYMCDLYPNAKIILTPDIVCSLEYSKQREREGALCILRNDVEKSIFAKEKNSFETVLKKLGLSISYSDMIENEKGNIGKANRERRVIKKLDKIASSQIVITDRLHGMIFCVITHTPCVVMADFNHKITSSYNTWFKEIPYIKLNGCIEDIRKDIEEVMNADKLGREFDFGIIEEEIQKCLDMF